MRQCTAIVIYKGTTLYSVYIKRKGSITPLITDAMRLYESIQELYKAVLLMLKANNLYCGYDNAKWYDIELIDLEKSYLC